jgi:hypothetical protein
MTKDDIFSIRDFRTEAVEIPEWNKTLHVRTFSGATRARIANLWKQYEKENRIADLGIHFVLLSTCDEHGTLLFTEADYDKVAALNANALDKLSSAAIRINGLGDDAVEAAKKN